MFFKNKNSQLITLPELSGLQCSRSSVPRRHPTTIPHNSLIFEITECKKHDTSKPHSACVYMYTVYMHIHMHTKHKIYTYTQPGISKY